MAGEEDVELRDLVAQTLEAKGILGKIRAQLRASVFLALEEQETQEKSCPLVNQKLPQYLKTKEGKLTTGLVREFLEFFELDFTCAVFDPETNVLDTYQGREQLARDAGVDPQRTPNGPLLASLLQQATQSSATRQLKFPEPSPVTSTLASFPLPTITESSRPDPSVTSSAPLVSLPTSTSAATDATTAGKDAITIGSLKLGQVTRTETATTWSASAPSTSSRVIEGKLNSNENSNLKVGPKVSSSSAPPIERPPISSKPALVDSFNVSIPGVHAELGETFANSSLDIEKLLNSSGDINELLRQAADSAESSGDELDDFFGTPLPSGLGALSREKDKTKPSRPIQEQGSEGKKPGLVSSLKDTPATSLQGAPPLSGLTDKERGHRGLSSQIGRLTMADGRSGPYEEDFHGEGGGTGSVSEHFEELSQPISSLASGKYETTDHTLSDNSLTGDFDHTEPVQS